MADETRPSTVLDCSGGTRVQQNQKDQCDINKIVGRYQRTGSITHIAKAISEFGDFSEVGDFFTAVTKVQAAQEAFDSLPAKVRSVVDNDTVKFVEFVENEKNFDECVELGLLDARPEVEKESLPGDPPPANVPKGDDESKIQGGD